MVPLSGQDGRISIPVRFVSAKTIEVACDAVARGSREIEKLRKVLPPYEVVTVRMVTLALMMNARVLAGQFERFVVVLLYSARLILRKARGGGMLTAVSDDSADYASTIPPCR